MKACWRALVGVTVTALCTLSGCIDPPNSPYVDVRDTVTRIDQLRPMAEQGSAEDQYDLGLQYEKARPQDHREAVRWYRMAAMQRHAGAFYRLCALSDMGRGIPQDYQEALRWCRLAADHRYGAAMFLIATYYEKARGVPKDVVQAYQWYNLAAANGHEDGAKWRDRLARDMTPTQIAHAQFLARHWKPKDDDASHKIDVPGSFQPE
ncbi:MAG: sel1 repeat family protein [Nitrospira sp.]|nr:sel1 repeat family protein [Nitrospira sp.]MDH4369372.1 sel1 repeat family protein [Nitrospira sp.]MDH5498092.1 sel1 repeat family protein [Nitrospira sp.]MDH5725255.1 sel1 repeat family protein [Nitrospira sp.]